jgi:hypothetical protein
MPQSPPSSTPIHERLERFARRQVSQVTWPQGRRQAGPWPEHAGIAGDLPMYKDLQRQVLPVSETGGSPVCPVPGPAVRGLAPDRIGGYGRVFPLVSPVGWCLGSREPHAAQASPGRACSGRVDGTLIRSRAVRWNIDPVPGGSMEH